MVELRRLRHLDSVNRTLSSAERHQGHRPVLVLKHAVFALQVQTVQDCRGKNVEVIIRNITVDTGVVAALVEAQ